MNPQNYQTAPIGKLQPDPNQLRTCFDDEVIGKMAISIKNEGVINAIEVDKDFVIITGELRLRAAKIAGLKEVPVKIIEKITTKDRLIRQMHENTHQNTMAPFDTARGLDKIRKLICPAAEQKAKRGQRQGETWGITELARLFGKKKSYYSEMLSLLGETGELREALKDPSFQRTKIASIHEAPKKYQKKLRHVVATQRNIPRDTVRHLVEALRRADKYEEVEKATELLNQNFEGMQILEALGKINKIVPDEESRCKEPADAVKLISGKVIEFIELLEEHPLDSFDPVHRTLTVRDITALGFYLQNYLQGKDMKNMKITKTKLIET